MLSLKELKGAFETAKFDYYYGEAKRGAKCPYLVATDNGSDNFAADNRVYTPKQGVALNLYCVKKSETTEASVEAVLDSLDIYWEKSEANDEDGNFYLTIYTFYR